MRLSLALLLLLAPASARADGPVHGKAVRSVEGCAADDAKTLEGAVDRAVKKVETCLKELNPKLAADILKGYGGFHYRCGQGGGMEGGKTTFAGGVPTVELELKPTGVQYDFEARTFHELIHAVDPQYKLINAAAHARAGATDAVYGCQLACYPGGIGAQETELAPRAGSKVPDPPAGYDPKAYMEPDARYLMDAGEYKLAADIYAGICAAGRPFLPAKVLDANCLANKIMLACPGAADKSGCTDAAIRRSAACELLCEEEDAGAQVSAAKKAARAIKSALADKTPLEGAVAGVFKQLNANKSLAACNK